VFEVAVMGEDGDVVGAMYAGEGLTSATLSEGAAGLDWAAEALLLTHEPLRRDMLEMQRVLTPQYFGDLPEVWRVNCFFRFFDGWCALVAQHQRVQVEVHHDWLAASCEGLPDGHRRELLEHAKEVETALLAISRMEPRILGEIAALHTALGGDDPWSEEAQLLRDTVDALFTKLRSYLTKQEELLPPLLREHWGTDRCAPDYVQRTLAAAAKAPRGGGAVKLLPWILHYLRKRDPSRARIFVAQLPRMQRIRLAMGGGGAYTTHLETLRAILGVDAPAGMRKPPSSAVAVAARTSQGDAVSAAAQEPDTAKREKARKQARMSAVLAAANSERHSQTNASESVREMAMSTTPLHNYGGDEFKWVNKFEAPKFDLWGKIGVEKPKTPRRM